MREIRINRTKNSMDHFGKLLTQGLKSIAALEKTDLTELQHELGKEIGVSVWTIYKWRKGTSIPNDDRTIELLGRASVTRGRMDKQWLTDYLCTTVYSSKQDLSEELFSEKQTFVIAHNLPRRQHQKLVGRDSELDEIRSFLSPHHRVGIVCISGSGGIGKTALALEIAHFFYETASRLSPDERFDTIIWVTAKNVELLPAGKVQRHPTFTDVDGIYRAIADLMDVPVIFRTATRAEQNIIINRLLAQKRVLLVLDNLEDVDDTELMIFLRDLPAPSKAVITTRHRIDVAVPIYLRTLDENTVGELVRMECARHQLTMSAAQINMLLRRTGGLPLAIIRTLGRMAWRGSNVEMEIQHLDDPHNEIYDFCFAKTVALIQPGNGYALFMALAIFATSASREAVGYVAAFGDAPLLRDEGLSDLEVLSLCYKNGECFGLEPLTRTQALSELHSRSEFEAQARERWVAWYTNFTARYGGRDQLEMHQLYDYLESEWDNILAVMHWCIDQGRYQDLAIMWNHVRDFTHIYGFWTDRLTLLNWLIVDADNRRDYAAAVHLMYDRAFTLTLTGPSTQLEEAETLLQRCWSLRQFASPMLQARVAALMASLCIKRAEHAEAHHWLDIGEDLLHHSGLEPIELARERTSLLFDRGENWFMMGDYAQAQTVFQEMLEQGTISGWQRSILHAQNWLTYTALMQKNLTADQQHLWQGWLAVSRIKERRLSAYFQRTFAYYYREIGSPSEALTWAEAALDSLERLGMSPDIHMMQAFIGQLRAE
jgi:hypothetical protein